MPLRLELSEKLEAARNLLYGDAAPAKQIMADFQPAFTKDSYLAFERGLFKKERWKPEA